jgi:tight adherence protein C
VSAASALAAISALLGLTAVRELLAAREHTAPARVPALDRRALAAGLRLGLPGRIARAGLEGRLSLSAVLAAKGAATLASVPVALWLAPAAPGRLSLFFATAIPVAAFLVPDALLERSARGRRAEILNALPDALDRLSVSAALGRGTAAGFEELTVPGGGALSEELSVAVAEISCGLPQREALASLRQRVPGPELAGLCAAIERSRRFGSPLAEQIEHQAAALRRDQRRRIEERAARAAPKIQLVVALVLVPSVLLVIVAAVIANADVLFTGL